MCAHVPVQEHMWAPVESDLTNKIYGGLKKSLHGAISSSSMAMEGCYVVRQFSFIIAGAEGRRSLLGVCSSGNMNPGVGVDSCSAWSLDIHFMNSVIGRTGHFCPTHRDHKGLDRYNSFVLTKKVFLTRHFAMQMKIFSALVRSGNGNT